jgi:hypothetical protein
MTTTTANIAAKFNVLEAAVVRVEEWASVMFCVVKGIGARFVSKKLKVEAKKMDTIPKTVRTTLPHITASGSRRGWYKLVTSVDTTKSNGYAFEGDFLKSGVELDLPMGSVIISKNPTGSVKNGGYDGYIYVVDSTELGYDEKFDWDRNFLSFRDAVAGYLKK